MPKLFQPIRVGDLALKHRIVLAPLTRFRGTNTHVPGPHAAEYYAQRARTPGTLLITEATFIAAKAGGERNVPGIWSKEQIAGWKKVTEAVHEKGSYIFLQLWALGRAANPKTLAEEDPNFDYVSSSPSKLPENPETPRALSVDEIHEYVQLYATAAHNAVIAGFDGVEIHGANGYLIEQFLQDTCNQRVDDYGGSIEGRTRFAKEIVKAVVDTVGEKKTGIRLSPWNYAGGTRMADSKPAYGHLVSHIAKNHPNFAYIHAVEPRVSGSSENPKYDPSKESNDFLREIWAPRPLICAGGFNRESALERAESTGDLIAFGRLFISNPDLPLRLQKNIPLTPSNRDTYYLRGNHTPYGYTDYPFADEDVDGVQSHL